MSKRIPHHPEVPAGETTVSWRSIGQLENTPDFREWLEREFPRGATEMANEEDAQTSRRSFLKLMGASTALAGFGMAACRRPESYILPYAKAPEWVIPGKATYYASSFPRAGGATPLVVTTFEGRPTKLGPNTLHPDHAGTDAFAQATVLDLYSPSRSRLVQKQGKAVGRESFDALIAELAKDKGAKLGMVFGRDDSPSRARMLKELQSKFGSAKFYAYEALEGEAMKAAGEGQRLVADFSKAERIVSLDCDFAGLDPIGPVTPFFDRRKPEGKIYDKKADAGTMNRLYMVESGFSLSGGMADHRLRVKPSQQLLVAAQILRMLDSSSSLVGDVPMLDAPMAEWVSKMTEDLVEGKSMVIAASRAPAAVHHLVAAINEKLGNIGEGKPLKLVKTDAQGLGDIKQLSADLNSGQVDTLILMTPANPVYDAPAELAFGDALAKAKTSIHLGLRTDATANACTWHVPASHYLESWADTRSTTGVYTVVQPMIFPLYPECVSELELLSALLSEEGTLLTGEGEEGAPSPAYTVLRETFVGLADDSEAAWKKLLHDGFLADSHYQVAELKLDAAAATAAVKAAPKPKENELEMIFATDGSIYDGRWIDNGWLQEAPDPISKICWDNVALIAPKTAKALGFYDEIVPLETWNAAVPPDGEGERHTGKLISLKVKGKQVEIPVQIGFGQAENTVIVSLGYGQGFDDEDELGRSSENVRNVGQVGVNTGFDVYPLRTLDAAYFVALETAPVLTGGKYSIASTQEHNAMNGRALAREVSTETDEVTGKAFDAQLAEVKKQGPVDSHAPKNISLYKQEDRQGQPLLSDKLHQWGMSIDLSSCMGCNACLVACQAENNIPIVGKTQLAQGREMHWIRMDRYFAAQTHEDSEGNKIVDEDNLEMIPQPVACVQCESAPCETVCPVNATVHSEDGLNTMAYNRCIGTRYCANNCPYKVRRFNFFDYNKRNPLVAHNLYWGPLGETQVGTSAHLQRNPNVTVRMRGVMEKCTYCVQRLKDAKIRQKRGQKMAALETGDSASTAVTAAMLRVPVDSVKVACQEACPADAMTFGNLLDKEASTMVRAKGVERNYDLLQYIGTAPRTSYLARVKNPNPAMPGSQRIGKATIHMH